MDIDEVKSIIKMLKLTSANKSIPLYSPYLFSDGVILKTCTGYSYTEISYDYLFKGAVNIYSLEAALNVLEDNEYTFNASDNTIVIETKDNLNKIELPVDNIEFPTTTLPDDQDVSDMFEVTEELLNIMRKCFIKCKGDTIFKFCYLNHTHMISTDGIKINMADLSNIEHKPKKPILLSYQIISILKPGYKIVCKDHSIYIIMPDLNGFSVLITDSAQKYPTNGVVSAFQESIENVKYVCNVAPLLKGIELSVPILSGEPSKTISLSKKGKDLTIYSVSAFTGKSKYTYPNMSSDIEDFDILNIPVDKLVKTELSYDLYVDPKRQDRIVLEDEVVTSVIVL